MRTNRNRRDGADGYDVVIGRNPVREALRAGRPLERVLVADSDGSSAVVKEIVDEARRRDVTVRFAGKRQLDRLAKGGVHQGVVAIAAPVAYAHLEDVLSLAAEREDELLLLVLDGIQDPHNLGSLLRSADGAGVHGVIVPNRRAAGLTMTVARTSAGAVEHVPVVQVSNIAQTLRRLKRQGVWIVGADMKAEQNYWEADLTGPLAIVVGGEDKGISRVVRELCDYVVYIPMFGQVNSLNAGVAGGLLLFEVLRQRFRESPSSRRNG